MQDLTGKITGSTLTAAEWNQLPQEVQNVITALSITLGSGDLNQLGKAIAGYVANGTFYTDSGVANAYVLSAVGSKQTAPAYTDGFEINFVTVNPNTGASTVNVAGLGVKDIRLAGGANPSSGDITGRVGAIFDSSNDWFELVVTEVSDGSVTNAKLADMAANTLKLRNAGSSGVPQDVKVSSLTEEAAPTAGDWLLGEESGGALRKFDFGNVAGAAQVTSLGSNANGHWRVWSDGLIEQWGKYAFSQSLGSDTLIASNIPFPIAFTTSIDSTTFGYTDPNNFVHARVSFGLDNQSLTELGDLYGSDNGSGGTRSGDFNWYVRGR